MTDVVIAWNPRTTDPWRCRSKEFVLSMWESYGYNVIWGLDDSEPFNIAKAKNNGVRQASSPKIVIADADVVIRKEQIEEALAKEGWFIPYEVYLNLTQSHTDEFLNGTRELDDCEWDHRILSWAGMIVVDRQAYWDVGGHDERFSGWGLEDVALRLSLDNLYVQHERVPGNIYHLWHPTSEARTFGSEEYALNEALFRREYQNRYNWKDERLKW